MICDCDGIFMWILSVHIWLWIYWEIALLLLLLLLLLRLPNIVEQKCVIALPTIRNENRCGHVNYENGITNKTICFLRRDERRWARHRERQRKREHKLLCVPSNSNSSATCKTGKEKSLLCGCTYVNWFACECVWTTVYPHAVHVCTNKCTCTSLSHVPISFGNFVRSYLNCERRQ